MPSRTFHAFDSLAGLTSQPLRVLPAKMETNPSASFSPEGAAVVAVMKPNDEAMTNYWNIVCGFTA